jgi:transcriptional regulator of NAD metabolism
MHTIADYAFKNPLKFIRWRLFGKYLIALSVKDLSELEQFIKVLKKQKIKFVSFFEPDINQITAIAIRSNFNVDQLTSKLKLANEKKGFIDKSNIINRVN